MSVNLQYVIKEGLLGLRRTRTATFVTVSTVAVTFSLLGIFLLLTVNVGQFVGIFQDKLRMDVFIDNSMTDTSIQKLQQKLSLCSGVKSITYITPEMALEQFREDFGEDPLEILGENPLPASFQVYLKATHRSPKNADEVYHCLCSHEGVDDVVYHYRFFILLHQYRKGLFIGTLVLFIIVLLAALFLVSNTLRITIYAQRDKIAIMELVGATPAFIRRPYLIQGVLQGLMGGGIGMAALWIVIQIVQIRFPSLLQVPVWLYGFPLVLGMLLGYVGSILAIRRFLRN